MRPEPPAPGTGFCLRNHPQKRNRRNSGLVSPARMAVSEDRGYTFVDYCTQGYLGLVGAILLVGQGRANRSWPLLLAGHVAAMGLIHALIRLQMRRPDIRLLTFLRHYYPVLLY